MCIFFLLERETHFGNNLFNIYTRDYLNLYIFSLIYCCFRYYIPAGSCKTNFILNLLNKLILNNLVVVLVLVVMYQEWLLVQLPLLWLSAW